jgi:galactonate dehydratase
VLTTSRKARVAQGFKAIKMNATEDISWLDSPTVLDGTIERVRAVKKLGLDVGLDFHGRLHRPMAKQLIKMLEPERPLFVEEPILSENVEAVKTLYDGTCIPIALGERLYSRWDVKPFLESRCVDILQPGKRRPWQSFYPLLMFRLDISHVGGISETMRIAHMAEAYDVALAPHCPLGPIALAASFQVDAVCSNFVIQEMSLGIHYNTNVGVDLKAYTKNPEAFDVQEGMVKVSDLPGLGIEIDEEAVRAAAVGAEAWKQPYFVDSVTGELREW